MCKEICLLFLYVQSVELTNEAIEFLKGVFESFDSDRVSFFNCHSRVFNCISGCLSTFLSIKRTLFSLESLL